MDDDKSKPERNDETESDDLEDEAPRVSGVVGPRTYKWRPGPPAKDAPPITWASELGEFDSDGLEDVREAGDVRRIVEQLDGLDPESLNLAMHQIMNGYLYPVVPASEQGDAPEPPNVVTEEIEIAWRTLTSFIFGQEPRDAARREMLEEVNRISKAVYGNSSPSGVCRAS